MSYMWLQMTYRTQFNKERSHTASVQKKSDIREILERYGSNPESVVSLTLNGKEHNAVELLGRD